ncbi:hypothetical protein ColLi_02704 [Colletotrichum liriopes]|uniref:Uncharacterized protein n=1 Tax=Colletotrichum liriopes TaxID=708192 RepID=A0AA37GG95_9PEZI|nr:hypothetical protein ColLi_02704 [Colletotrichum liriopes]
MTVEPVTAPEPASAPTPAFLPLGTVVLNGICFPDGSVLRNVPGGSGLCFVGTAYVIKTPSEQMPAAPASPFHDRLLSHYSWV